MVRSYASPSWISSGGVSATGGPESERQAEILYVALIQLLAVEIELLLLERTNAQLDESEAGSRLWPPGKESGGGLPGEGGSLGCKIKWFRG